MSFDHHESETERVKGKPANHVIEAHAPSAARVVYNYYGGQKAFPRVSLDMMAAVDKGDSAQFSRDEILESKGWNLLNFLMDSRTGLGRFRDFRISNYALMMDLIGYCQKYGDDIDSLLAEPDVKERSDLYFEHESKAREQILKCSKQNGNVVVLDLRAEETIYAANRFLIYALYPASNVSIHVLWGLKQQNTVFAVGKSILDRSCKSAIGSIMLQYGGGGHDAAGTCQVPNDQAEPLLSEIVERLVQAG
jgi:nanoRNase/pAp phosphatase (c-di-AMP/oligoRNAs hydrolase)